MEVCVLYSGEKYARWEKRSRPLHVMGSVSRLEKWGDLASDWGAGEM